MPCQVGIHEQPAGDRATEAIPSIYQVTDPDALKSELDEIACDRPFPKKFVYALEYWRELHKMIKTANSV